MEPALLTDEELAQMEADDRLRHDLVRDYFTDFELDLIDFADEYTREFENRPILDHYQHTLMGCLGKLRRFSQFPHVERITLDE